MNIISSLPAVHLPKNSYHHLFKAAWHHTAPSCWWPMLPDTYPSVVCRAVVELGDDLLVVILGKLELFWDQCESGPVVIGHIHLETKRSEQWVTRCRETLVPDQRGSFSSKTRVWRSVTFRLKVLLFTDMINAGITNLARFKGGTTALPGLSNTSALDHDKGQQHYGSLVVEQTTNGGWSFNSQKMKIFYISYML